MSNISKEEELIRLKSGEEMLDTIVKAWNNYIGDMPDKEKDKLTYLECTGALWGIAADYQIRIDKRLKELTSKESKE